MIVGDLVVVDKQIDQVGQIRQRRDVGDLVAGEQQHGQVGQPRQWRDVGDRSRLRGDGHQFTSAFADLTRAKRDKSTVPYRPVLDTAEQREFKAEYDKHHHNFDDQSTFSHHAVRG